MALLTHHHPARLITPIPVMITPKGLPVITSPKNTPISDRSTELSTIRG